MTRSNLNAACNKIGLLEKELAEVKRTKGCYGPSGNKEVDLVTQLIDQLEQKIAALEEYCLNVDHHNIPVPDKLSYLFQKACHQA